MTGQTAEQGPSVETVREELRAIVDPCTAATGSNLDIVEMGLVESIDVASGAVHVSIRLTTPACHMVPYFIEEIESRVGPLAGVESVTVDTDDGMTWTPELMTDEATERRQAALDARRSRLSDS